MRRCYQKWAEERRKVGPEPTWDGFVEACKQHFEKMLLLDDLDKQLEREDAERERERVC